MDYWNYLIECYYFFNYGKQIHLLQNKCYYLDIDSICYKNIVDTCYRLDNIHKLLYAISYYKVSDLQEICNKLDIDNNINYIIPSNINHCNKLTT